jgi:hypothetical protein
VARRRYRTCRLRSAPCLPASLAGTRPYVVTDPWTSPPVGMSNHANNAPPIAPTTMPPCSRSKAATKRSRRLDAGSDRHQQRALRTVADRLLGNACVVLAKPTLYDPQHEAAHAAETS